MRPDFGALVPTPTTVASIAAARSPELDIGYRLIYAPVLQEPRRGFPQETAPRRTTY